MKFKHMSDPARNALAHPQVLKGAWMRINEWYGSGNLAPEPELSRWRLHPEGELRRLGEDLRLGKWQPVPWTQLPYPKKGAQLRHYVQPTVRDQVAFMAHMVVLGPLIDNQVPSFAFGNRWYRPVVWDRRDDPQRWRLRPYPLLTRRTFLPYARDHGMFRRVAHWTAANMVNKNIPKEDFGGRIQHPDDHNRRTLPQWVRRDWWNGSDAAAPRVSWAALDIQLAYPCVQLDRLSHNMKQMLAGPNSEPTSKLLSGYPAPVLRALSDPSVRNDLVDSTISALRRVRISDPQIPDDAWRPNHLRGTLPERNQNDGIGIPTGLAISGLLFNAALNGFDRAVNDHLNSQEAPRPGALVRFADDMYILARSPAALFALMDAVGRALAEDPNATLADLHSITNLHMSVAKIRPEAVRKVMICYLRGHNWTPCDKCESLNFSDPATGRRSLEDWWVKCGSDNSRHKDRLHRASVGPRDLGPFVTTLVERLSDIGTDTLAERFGPAAEDRLGRLHELARFDIDDEQVRPDTRRTFAANRLVRAWLPDDADQAGRALADIRASVGYVLQRTPWKFSLWRAVVRAAARRSNTQDSDSDHEEARRWLTEQLQCIATQPVAVCQGASAWWPDLWPEELRNEHPRTNAWTTLYLSYHRTAFWHALAETLRAVWWDYERTNHPRNGEADVSPTSWAVRAVPTGCQRAVLQFLGEIEEWVRMLYGEEPPDAALNQYPWEVDQLVVAVLASRQRAELAREFRHAPAAADVLTVPPRICERIGTQTTVLLRAARRVSQHRRTRTPLGPASLAHVRLGGADRRLGRVLFRGGSAAAIHDAAKRPEYTVAVGVALGCAEDMNPALTDGVVSQPKDLIEKLREDPFAFGEYHLARSIRLGTDSGNS